MVLIDEVSGRRVVSAACAVCLRAGVRAGMVLADAQALMKRPAMVARRDGRRDAAALEALSRWAMRWSPIVAPEDRDGMVIDITGCEHLFGGELGLARQIGLGLAGLGITARLGIASTVGAAWAAARFGGRGLVRVAPGREAEALRPLPVGALRIGAAAVDGLAEVGVRRVGELLDLPRCSLPSRYGREIVRRIDEALGAVHEPIHRLAEEVRCEASIELPGGSSDAEAIGLATREVLLELSRQLLREESGARRVGLVYRHVGGACREIVVQVSRATRDASHLWALARPRVERLPLDEGVEVVVARGCGVSRVSHEQGVLGRGRCRGDEPAFAGMLDTIANRIGAGGVRRVVFHASHRPERAWRLVSAAESPGSPRSSGPGGMVPDRPRPSRLLESPVPIEAALQSPDGPVLRIGCAAGRGPWVGIVSCLGPERLGGEWWSGRESSRDYFRVQDECGRWLWIFRELRSGSWFLHGWWG